MENEGYIDLKTLQLLAKSALEEAFPGRLWLRAEVVSVSVKPNGHCYMELSQSEKGMIVAKARAVVWKSRWPMLSAFFESVAGCPIAAGIEILAQVQVTYSEIWGFSLNIDDINPEFTLGDREKTRRETIKRLEDEGLMDLQKELVLPDLPYRLAIVSATGAAGLGDFLDHLHGNAFGFKYKTVLYEAAMQGRDAPESIAAALDEAQGSGEKYDAVLVLRGGGSELDLACFDEYDLCAAIASCPFPVLTAIGHERDYHVADMVANAFVKTPTALADMLVDMTAAEDARIDSFRSRLSLAFTSRVHSLSAATDALGMRIRSSASGRVEAAEAAVRLLETKIAALDPRNVLKRGFSLALDGNGVRLKSALDVSPGGKVRVVFADGTVGARVEEVIKENQT